MVPEPVASAPPKKLLEMQILSPLQPTESETLGEGPTICVLVSPLGDSNTLQSLETIAIKKQSLCVCLGCTVHKYFIRIVSIITEVEYVGWASSI